MEKRSPLVEPLRRFRGNNPKERNAIMAMFCGKTVSTASEWGRVRDPQGEPLNKLWYLLDAYGIEVLELQKVNPVVRYVGKLVAYGVLLPSEALSVLGLSGPLQPLWRSLQGHQLPNTVKQGSLTLKSLQSEYDERLERAVQQKQAQGLIPAPDGAIVSRAARVDPKSSQQTLEVHDGVNVAMAAAFISGLEPLLRHIDQEGPASVEALRRAVSFETFHNVLDSLKLMSSRKAREFYHGT